MRRCTQGLSLIILILVSGAYILDDMALLLAAGTLLCGLLGQYLLFDYRLRGIVSSVTVQRTPERSQVRKGTTLHVSTTVTLTVPFPMHVRITEKLSPQVAILDGDTTHSVEPDMNPRICQFRYRIMPIVHGMMRFSGITLSVQNAFFSHEIDLFSDPFSGPDLLIQPVGMFEPSGKHSTAESREVEKLKVVSGFGIRALREYYVGDDLRRIDWKLSAKHNKLFVREYTGMVNLPPLLIIDLPWSGAAFLQADFDQMVSVVAGQAEHAIRSYQYISLLLISGSNILFFSREEKNLQQCMAVLREWMHPVERVSQQYHTPDRADVRAEIRHLEAVIQRGADPKILAYSDLLRKHYLGVLLHMRVPVFSGQVARTLSSIPVDECYIYSLGCGDTSHIRQVIRQAKIADIIVHLRLPGAHISSSQQGGQIYSSADTVEAFA